MILLPRPQKLLQTEGSFSLTPETCIVLAEQARGGLICAQQLQEEIERFAGLRLDILCGDEHKGDILLTLD